MRMVAGISGSWVGWGGGGSSLDFLDFCGYFLNFSWFVGIF